MVSASEPFRVLWQSATWVRAFRCALCCALEDGSFLSCHLVFGCCVGHVLQVCLVLVVYSSVEHDDCVRALYVAYL